MLPVSRLLQAWQAEARRASTACMSRVNVNVNSKACMPGWREAHMQWLVSPGTTQQHSAEGWAGG